MNTYKDPEYRGYYLGKVAVALVLLIIVVIAASRYPGATTAPAEAPATPAAGSAQLTPGGSETTTSPAAETSGTSTAATGAPETAQAPATAAVPGEAQAPTTATAPEGATAAAPAAESPVPIAAATAAPAGITTAAPAAVQAPATGAAQKDVAVSGTVSAPTSATGTSSLSALSATMDTPSDYQTGTVSGGHLTANINISAPSGLKISMDGTTYYSSPIINVSTSSLSAFSTMVGAPSAAQTYTVSGSDLTADISINAPAGFEISEDGSTYSPSLTLTQSDGAVAATTIYVRLTGAAEGSYDGNITHTSTSAPAVVAPGVTQVPAPDSLAAGAPATAAPAPAGRATAAPPKAVVPAAATEETASTGPGLTITRAVVDDGTGQVTLIGTGRPNAPIEIVRDGKAVTRVLVKGDGTWKHTYQAAPGAQVVAVQYEGQPNSRSLPLRFESTGMQAAAPTSAAGSQAGAGQAYIVRDGDYLRALALRFYGDQMQWPVIYDGTNAMAARDASFAVIDDPDVIVPGWKLWIPAK